MAWYMSAFVLLKFAIGFVAIWGIFIHPRRNLAKKAGGLLLVIVDSKKQKWQILLATLCAMVVALPIALELLLIKEIGPFTADFWVIVAAVVFAVPRFRYGPAYLEIRENGLIRSGMQFFGWDQVRNFKWLGSPPNRLFVRTPHFVINHRVAEHQRREVTWLLSQHSKIVDAAADAA